ncbi:MAG: acetyl-CoA acetyltransferase [Acidimicrobiales bacterium]
MAYVPGNLDPNTPVLVGVGQVTNRSGEPTNPMDLMAEAAQLALTDTGAPSSAVATRLDAVQVVNILAWHYPHPAATLSEVLGLPDGERLSTTVGGNTPQWLVSRACDDIAAGRRGGVLICGAEALDSVKRARAAGIKMARGDRNAPPAGQVIGDDRPGLSPAEMAAGLLAPALVYPLFESVLADRAGHSPDEHRQFLGRVMARFTTVAARHPDLSWFPDTASPEELSTPSPDNRMVAEPYTKRLNSIIQVDQGAALILMSAARAAQAGIPTESWVFPWSGAECNDVYFFSERPDLARSAGIAAAGFAALSAAGVGIDDMAHIDLYSCFPSAVQMGAEALGLDLFDPRYLTVTGGLAYFGGPGNNYATHSIAMMAQRCRRDPTSLGLISALGWFVTKHAIGIYSATPPPRGWSHPSTERAQDDIDNSALVVATDGAGTATVEAMTVIHDRHDGPIGAPIIARLADGRRVVATTGPEVARALTCSSLVDHKVDVTAPSSGSSGPSYIPA